MSGRRSRGRRRGTTVNWHQLPRGTYSVFKRTFLKMDFTRFSSIKIQNENKTGYLKVDFCRFLSIYISSKIKQNCVKSSKLLPIKTELIQGFLQSFIELFKRDIWRQKITSSKKILQNLCKNLKIRISNKNKTFK